jgi:hypothetical protein
MLPWSTDAQADAAIHRRGDAAVVELETGTVDLPLIGFDDALDLIDESLLRRPSADRRRCTAVLVPLEIDARIVQHRLILDAIALRPA